MSTMRADFDRAREAAAAAHRGGTEAREVLALHTQRVDEILVRLFAEAVPVPDQTGVVLLALGGYGRCELAPFSDLDVLILHRGWSADDVAEVNRRFLYPLWDAGLDVGNRVRDPREAVRMLDRVDEATAVLDARALAGDPGLHAELERNVARRLERGRASFLRDLWNNVAERHERFGHAGHLLEPDLRDAAGGLRDVQTLRWAARVLPGADGLAGLEVSGALSVLDRRHLEASEAFAFRIRIESHLAAGRRQDQLLLGAQDELAVRLGYPPGDQAPGDALMREVYRHARTAESVVTETWARIMTPARRRRLRSGPRTLGDGCILQNGRVEVVAAPGVHQDPAAWLRAFTHAARQDVRVGRSSLNRLQQSLAGGGTVPWTPDARAVFIELLSTGASATGALEAMDSVGFLGALVDGWGPVRGLPQRNLYHRYTVDMHLFATVAELTAGRSASDPLVGEAWSRVSDPEPLVLGAFLHDVGKGRGGDHSEIGAELARHAVRRMGLTDERTDDVHFLVREHLWMAETATRRDLNDPATITETARLAGTTDRLAMLFLLTRADALATGPEAWSAFREALVRELYDKAHAVLAGDRGIFGEAPRLAALAAEAGLSVAEAGPLIEGMPAGWLEGTDVQAAARQLAVLSEPLAPGEVRTSVYTGEATDELIVVAHDRPGLLASTAGVLALRGVDVHSADVYTRSGAVAVQIFRTSGAHGSVPPERWERVRTDIADATSGRLDLDEALRRKASHLRVHPTRRGASRVVVDNGLSEGFSVVEVHTRDRLGLLRQVVGTLHRAGCDVHAAKVTTYGTEVVDVFWVRDVGGRRITDPAEVRRINDALLAALDR